MCVTLFVTLNSLKQETTVEPAMLQLSLNIYYQAQPKSQLAKLVFFLGRPSSPTNNLPGKCIWQTN